MNNDIVMNVRTSFRAGFLTVLIAAVSACGGPADTSGSSSSSSGNSGNPGSSAVCGTDVEAGAALYKSKNCLACHGAVPTNGTTAWSGNVGGIDLFDSKGDGYNKGDNTLVDLPLTEFIKAYMPSTNTGSLTQKEANQLSAYLTHTVNSGQQWCPSGNTSSSSSSSSGGQAALECDVNTVRPARVWKLSPVQLVNTAESLLPKANLSIESLADTIAPPSHGFSNAANQQVLSTPHVNELVALADDFTERVLDERQSLDSCLRGDSFDKSCLTGFLDDFLTKAFRRPADKADINRYIQFFEQEARKRERLDAFRQMVRGVFLSTNFLFRTELGPNKAGEIGPMDQYERASALSYVMYDGPPDASLLRAAKDGKLSTSAQLSEQATRLMSSPKSAKGMIQFLSEFYGVGRVLSSEKDSELYPDWGRDVAENFLGESKAFFEEVLFKDDARFATILTADYSMINKVTAPYYGLSSNTQSGRYERRTLPAGERSGVLTQGAFLAPISGFDEPDITKRGHFVREDILCQNLPPVPDNVPPLPEVEGVSRRERLETVHANNPVCNACHVLMDPLGYSFEHYDAIGKWRDTENVGNSQVSIDSSGTIVDSSQGDVRITDATDLAQVLTSLPEAQECFVDGLAEYLAGGHNPKADSCRLDQATEAFQLNGGDIKALVIQLLSDENFYLRQSGPNSGSANTPDPDENQNTPVVPGSGSSKVEAEDYDNNSPASPFEVQNDNGRSIVVWPGNNNGSNANPTDNADGQLFYSLIASSSNVTLYATVNFSNADNDSIHYKLEGKDSSWTTLNNAGTNGYQEITLKSWNDLKAGQKYTFKVQRREDGAKLDSLRVEGGQFSQ